MTTNSSEQEEPGPQPDRPAACPLVENVAEVGLLTAKVVETIRRLPRDDLVNSEVGVPDADTEISFVGQNDEALKKFVFQHFVMYFLAM